MPSWSISTGKVEDQAGKGMNAEIRVVGEASGVELAELGRWLAAQRGLVGRVAQVQGEVGEQELSGGAVELLSVALGSGGAVSVLSGALSAWLGSRQQTIKITVDGKSAEFPAGTEPEVVARYLKAVKGEDSRA
jgi:hypothetical protein